MYNIAKVFVDLYANIDHSQKSTRGSAHLDLRGRFGEVSLFRFVSFRLSIAFFLISSAVSLSFSRYFEAESDSAVALSSLSTNSLMRYSFSVISTDIPLAFSPFFIFLVNFFLSRFHRSLTDFLSFSWNFGE